MKQIPFYRRYRPVDDYEQYDVIEVPGFKPARYFQLKRYYRNREAFEAIVSDAFKNWDLESTDIDYLIKRLVIDAHPQSTHLMGFHQIRAGIFEISIGSEMMCLAGGYETYLYFFDGNKAMFLKLISWMRS